MRNISNLPLNLDSTSLACRRCANHYYNKKELLHHLRSSSDELHKTFRNDACTSSIEPTLLALGILPCPRACGALFDGGANCTSRPLERHIETGNCRARNPGAVTLPREPTCRIGLFTVTLVHGERGFGEGEKEGKGKRPFSPFPLFPPPQTYFSNRKCLYFVLNADIMFMCLCFLSRMQWNLSLGSLALVHGN